MPRREDLTYKKEVAETPYMYTSAADIDEAIERAYKAVCDARSFREVARATGTDVVRYKLDVKSALLFFAAGMLACLWLLCMLGAI